jgi:hypothetical protein
MTRREVVECRERFLVLLERGLEILRNRLSAPLPSALAASPMTSFSFQNRMAQCALNAAIMPSGLSRYMKEGVLHLIASSTSGHASCTTARMCVRIGFA